MRFISHPGTAAVLTVLGLSVAFGTSSAIAWTSGYRQGGVWLGSAGGVFLLLAAFVLGYLLSQYQDEHIEAGQRLLDKHSITETEFQRKYLGVKDYEDFKHRRHLEQMGTRADNRAMTDAEIAFDKIARAMSISFTEHIIVTERFVNQIRFPLRISALHLNASTPAVATGLRLQVIRDGEKVDLPAVPEEIWLNETELVQTMEVNLDQCADWGEFEARILLDANGHTFASPPFTVPSVQSTEDSRIE